MRRRWLALLVLPGLAGVFAVQAHAVDSPLCVPGQARPTAALTPADWHPQDDGTRRLHHYTVTSPAMGMDVPVDILDAPDMSRPYQVLYLLHGHGGNANDWSTHEDTLGNDLVDVIGGRQLLVVMPSGGYDGWYSDWYGVDVDGHNGATRPQWETFHMTELRDFINVTYHPTGSLIAGLSMGGYGAIEYAERHSGFAAVASFSGALDTQLYEPAEPEVQPLFQNATDRKEPDNCIWGDGVLQRDTWTEHNPTANVSALEDIPVYASSGDGCAPSPANVDPLAPTRCTPDPSKAGAMFTEWGVRQQNEAFRTALLGTQRSAPAYFDFYGPGDHSWPYWIHELSEFLTWTDSPHS